ncbi:MAG TPA: cryptochrome/photolyase family protein, partial [Microbacteriaceae bacterium]
MISQFSKRKYHRQKAHLILSAIRHRAEDPEVKLVSLDSYRDIAGEVESVVNPTSFNQRRLVNELGLEIHPSRGFVASEQEFAEYVASKNGKRLVLEDFYRKQRLRTGLLMTADQPEGGQWNFDHDNRLPPPKQSSLGVAEPWYPTEDAIDHQVRIDLDQLEKSGVEFSGEDGPRLFPASREEALEALEHFVNHRLDLFGPYEDAVLKDDWAMSHSLLSAPMNMGLLDPLEVAKAAEQAFLQGQARLASVEGFIRQVIGWRDYVWHLYWHFGEDYVNKNELVANNPLPTSWQELRGDDIEANCLSSTIGDISKRGWAHHIPRLMIIGNIAMQRGFSPRKVN